MTSNQDEEGGGSGKSFFAKQKMLQQRIEKLRSLEAKVISDTVCSKKNCPVSLDPRTTSERYQNAELIRPEAIPGKELRDRIDRFRTTQKA